MTRITTPFDDFIRDLTAWLDSAWFVWVAMALCIGFVVAIVSVSKVRARARARIPQYRRQRQS